MGEETAQKKRRLTPEEKAFFQEYPDAPYLLRVQDTLLLASAEAKANDLAQVAGCQVEKIYKPIKTSTDDVAS